MAAAQPALLRFFRKPAITARGAADLLRAVNAAVTDFVVTEITSEYCFYVQAAPLTADQLEKLSWLLRETYEPDFFAQTSFLEHGAGAEHGIVEVGPRMNFTSAYSTNAVGICSNCDIPVTRLERYRRYKLVGTPAAAASSTTAAPAPAPEAVLAAFAALVHDRMTEWRITAPLTSFALGGGSGGGAPAAPAPVKRIPVLARGAAALAEANKEYGLAMDARDIDYYTALFRDDLKRDPTDVELYDISQSNSEHSRHWFFRGRMVVDGEEQPRTLMDIVKGTLAKQPHNTKIAFADNSSAITGYEVTTMQPTVPGAPSPYTTTPVTRHCLLTAETHNAPSAIAPFAGAETGTGGRIRDTHATGTGSHVCAGTTGYCVGALKIPGYALPWEDEAAAAADALAGAAAAAGVAAGVAAGAATTTPTSGAKPFCYPGNAAKPLDILVQASNGASDYGNKFGEPVVAGFARSVGLRLLQEQADDAAGAAAPALAFTDRREYVKPIMFTAGIGAIDDAHLKKAAPTPGMLVVKLGGPAYRIGMGGSAASSMMQGENKGELDFASVQRGDAEMEQKVNRVIRACVEQGPRNPIVSIHDQGAGGNCNVLKEIVDPAGGIIHVRSIISGDATLSVLELWASEYQEADALLLRPESRDAFVALCARERVPVAVVGEVTGDGRLLLIDDDVPETTAAASAAAGGDGTDGSAPIRVAVDFDLETVLGGMPAKTFTSTRETRKTAPFALPAAPSTAAAGGIGIDRVAAALDRVLRLVSVGSKRFLTNKVDRSVTGLVAQQQCVGPLHTPLADVAVLALTFGDTVGTATAIGEQPVKGLAGNLPAMARMATAEAVTNLASARVSSLVDAKCSANWMWAAKLKHEGAALYDACDAMGEFMGAIGVAVDGGKDSLSMATIVPDGEVVKAPGTLVISLYCSCPDITVTATPDFKRGLKGATDSAVIVVDLTTPATAPTGGKHRLGGSALAQTHGAVGSADQVPDCDHPALLVSAFNVIQALHTQKADGAAGGVAVLQALHDISDGGLVTTLIEMAIAGNCGVRVALPEGHIGAGVSDVCQVLFAEELGWVLEVPTDSAEAVVAQFTAAGVHAFNAGSTTGDSIVSVAVRGETVLSAPVSTLRGAWEDTSCHLERLQCNPACADSEAALLAAGVERKAPPFALTFTPEPTPATITAAPADARHRVVVLREEGTNGDREMSYALMAAGFEVWDVTMSDLLAGRVTLDAIERLRGLVFPGGFSYADTLDSAKGWAGTIRFHPSILAQFQRFGARADTFSLGVCNGCQLMALMGWVPSGPTAASGAAGAASTAATADIEDAAAPAAAATAAASVAAAPGAPVIADETHQPRFVHNKSGRFESRFSTVRIKESPAIMMRGMHGSVLGVWVAHGEGYAHFPDPAVLAACVDAKLIPMTYVDEDGADTEVYPFNPNGSPLGIAGLCTPDGRHLAVMPHPERVVQTWQWPWMPRDWAEGPAALKASPWLRMFQNAREWCDAAPAAKA